MNSSYVTAKKETKQRKKTLSIQIYDDDICKIECKSLVEQTDSHRRNLSRDSNNIAPYSASLILSETVSNNSVHTFRISKSSLNNSIVRKGVDFSLNSSQDKMLNIKASKYELNLASISIEPEDDSHKQRLINRSSSSDSINKSYISNFSVIEVNKDQYKQSEIANKSLMCTPNTICNYYLHSNDITPNKLCYNLASNLSNPTDALNSVSATSSNQDLKVKISKINFINNVYNFNTSCAFEEIASDNYENNSNFNHAGRNYCDKRTPIKYNKSQFRSGEKCNNIKEDSSRQSSSNKNPSSSLNEMLKINSKPIDERLSLIAREFKKNLNISELEIERDDEKNIDSKNMSYSNKIDIDFTGKVIDENFKIFHDAKNLNFAFEQIKDLEETNPDCKDYTTIANRSNNVVDNSENNNHLTINVLKNENFSFDITHNKAAINVINDVKKANHNEVINEMENEHGAKSERKDYQEQDYTGIINVSNSIKRIDNYSFGSVHNTSMNNLTALCSTLQQNRANLIDKLSNNLRKFNLHPDLRSLFRKNKSHKQFENTLLEKNGEKLVERGDDSKKEKSEEIVNSQEEKIELSGEKFLERISSVNLDNDFILSNSTKNHKTKKISSNYITNEKATAATLPSTAKTDQLGKQDQASKIQSCSKELSEFEIKKSASSVTKSKKEEIPNRIGLSIKEIVIRAKDKDNKTSSMSYFSPGERKKNSISPRYNLKKTESKPILSKETLISQGRNPKFFDIMKLYSTKRQGTFNIKRTSPIIRKFNSYTKSHSSSKLNGASFVSNNSHARSASRNNSKNRTIEATYHADQTTGNQSLIKIENSVRTNEIKDFKFTEAIEAEESIRKKLTESEYKLGKNLSNISQFKKHVIPVYTKDKTLGIIKSMKDMSKHSDASYNCVTDRIESNSNDGHTIRINNKEIKTRISSATDRNTKLNNKIKLTNQINNVHIPSVLILGKENKKYPNNVPQEQARNNLTNYIQNNKASESITGNINLNRKDNLSVEKDMPRDSLVKEKDTAGYSSNSGNILSQNKKTIQVISNFSNYTKKKTPVARVNATASKQSNEGNNQPDKPGPILYLDKINDTNEIRIPAQSGRITLSNNRSRLMKEKINNIINKQIVSSKIKYLSGDDDFVFFDE